MKIYALDNLNINDWIQAGKLTSEALNYAKKIIDNGVSIVDVVEKIEKRFNPAFPLNISMNNIAAHDTAGINDDRIIEGVVKVDFGVNVNGAIGDSAITIDLTDRYNELIEANKTALAKALNYVKNNYSNVEVNEIGKIIYSVAKQSSFGIIKNLTGHGLGLNQIHTDPTIYNFDANSIAVIKPYFAFAIEPFFTITDSLIKETGNAKIFQLKSLKPIRDSRARKILDYINANFKTNPFASRWLLKEFTHEQIEFGLYKLVKNGNLIAYKPLVNVNNSIVTQFEHTVVLTKEKAIISTDLKE